MKLSDLKPHGNAYDKACQQKILDQVRAGLKGLRCHRSYGKDNNAREAARIDRDVERDVAPLVNAGVYVPPAIGALLASGCHWGITVVAPRLTDLDFILSHMPDDNPREVSAEVEATGAGNLSWKITGRNGKDGNYFEIRVRADLGFPCTLNASRWTAEVVHHDECTEEDQEVGRCECESQVEWSGSVTLVEKNTPATVRRKLRAFLNQTVWG